MVLSLDFSLLLLLLSLHQRATISGTHQVSDLALFRRLPFLLQRDLPLWGHDHFPQQAKLRSHRGHVGWRPGFRGDGVVEEFPQ